MILRGKDGQFYTDEHPKCSKCRQFINAVGINGISFWKVEKIVRWYCQTCWPKIKSFGIVEIDRVVHIDAAIPKDASPVFDERPDLADSKGAVSVFEAASQRIAPAENIIDKTRIAGRESIHGAQIGAPDMALLEEKDKRIQASEGLIFLDKLAQAELMIPETKKKLLEGKQS